MKIEGAVPAMIAECPFKGNNMFSLYCILTFLGLCSMLCNVYFSQHLFNIWFNYRNKPLEVSWPMMDMQQPIGLVLCGDPHEAEILTDLCDTIKIEYWSTNCEDIYYIFFFKKSFFAFIRYFISSRNFKCSAIH